eukprot:4949391-Amphidinium_carterae.1
MRLEGLFFAAKSCKLYTAVARTKSNIQHSVQSLGVSLFKIAHCVAVAISCFRCSGIGPVIVQLFGLLAA